MRLRIIVVQFIMLFLCACNSEVTTKKETNENELGLGDDILKVRRILKTVEGQDLIITEKTYYSSDFNGEVIEINGVDKNNQIVLTYLLLNEKLISMYQVIKVLSYEKFKTAINKAKEKNSEIEYLGKGIFKSLKTTHGDLHIISFKKFPENNDGLMQIITADDFTIKTIIDSLKYVDGEYFFKNDIIAY